MNPVPGSCLCGAVRYQLAGPLRGVIACHCTQCRKLSGHFIAATAVRRQHFRLLESRGLRWYRASAAAERGFCGECGSSLFWQPDGGDSISIFAGTLDGEPALRVEMHIFAADKGCYYDIAAAAGTPVLDGDGPGLPLP